MLERLSNHALLDRSSADNKIGFVNNFVLGHFVAMDLNEEAGEWLAESIFVEAVVNAYSARAESGRLAIWEKLADSLLLCSDETRVKLELRLLDRVSGDYKGAHFEGISFDTKNFFDSGSLNSCIFFHCTFSNCTFDFYRIDSTTQFISCFFYNCTFSGPVHTSNFASPVLDSASSCSLGKLRDSNSSDVSETAEMLDVKSFILEKFWPVGKDTVAFAHRPIFIFYRGGTYTASAVTKEIESMKKDGIVVDGKKKNWIGLNLSGGNFQIIKEILGR
jgi:uncharacterized protein YjbI with pentapeptide repeats